MALPIAAFPEMLTKSVITRATTTTRAGCVQRGMGHTEDDPRPNIFQLNTEGITENKISVIE